MALFQPLMPFVLNPEHPVITEEQRTLIERLLLERILLRGICRAVGVGLQGLLQFMVVRVQATPEHLYVTPTDGAPMVILQRLEAELDELWSYVGKKANRRWVSFPPPNTVRSPTWPARLTMSNGSTARYGNASRD